MAATRRSRRMAADILTYAVLVSMSLFCVGPIVWMFLTSLKLEADIVTRTMQYIPSRITFTNYVSIWTQSGFPVLIGNSLVVTFITVSICLLTGTLAAYAFSRY